MDQMLRREAALLGHVPSYRMQVSTIDASTRLVAAGLGHAILPREAVAPQSGAGRLAFVPLAETWAVRRFVVMTRPEPPRSATAGLLAESLREMAR